MEFALLSLCMVLPISTALTSILLLLVIIAWLLSLAYPNYRWRVQSLYQSSANQFISMFYGLFILGTFYSVANANYIKHSLNKMAKWLVVPILASVFQNENLRKKAFLIIIFATMFNVMIGIIDHEFKLGYSFKGSAVVFKDHIHTNFFVSIAIFLCLHGLNVKNFIPKRLNILFIGIFIYYVYFYSTGRTGYLICALLIGLWGLQKSGLKGFLKAGLLMGIICSLAFSFSPFFHNRSIQVLHDIKAHTMGKRGSAGISDRLDFYKNSWYLFKQKPLLGWGTGSFEKVYHEHALKTSQLITKNPHNEYLYIMVQLGLVGLTSFIGLFIYLFRCSFALPQFEKYILQGLLLSMMAGMMANSWIRDFSSGHFFMVMLALCLSSGQKKESSSA
ncbi:MAG: O-antigen ligase [Francisellaceae bacterium]|nr:O-antigen ligase [Francisellaceae bacterium]